MKERSLCSHETGGNNVPIVRQKCATYDARGNGDGGVTCTITGGHQSTISDYTAIVIENKGDTEMNENIGSVVRRLTPLECERLQGYPDGWTDIGEWTDSKGKKHKEADSPRYKALGNSIAIPFWDKWLAARMCKVLREDGIEQPTMASLFDGIGGFPLSFSRHGCKPVWASEIEEFPIAVTKCRFGEE
jgi:DNA (cytosine-5)-methyltransferase 1